MVVQLCNITQKIRAPVNEEKSLQWTRQRHCTVHTAHAIAPAPRSMSISSDNDEVPLSVTWIEASCAAKTCDAKLKTTCCLLARFLGVIASSARIEPMQHFERFAMSRVSLCRELQHESIYHMTSVRGCREPSHAECDNHADGSFTRCPGIHICPYTWRVV